MRRTDDLGAQEQVPDGGFVIVLQGAHHDDGHQATDSGGLLGRVLFSFPPHPTLFSSDDSNPNPDSRLSS